METSNLPSANQRKDSLQEMLEIVNQLIEGSATIAGLLLALEQVSRDLGESASPLSPEMLAETEQLFVTANLLLYKQQSLIKHRRTMEHYTQMGNDMYRQYKARKGGKNGEEAA